MLYLLFVLLLLLSLAVLLWPVRDRSRLCVTLTLVFIIGTLGMYKLAGSPEVILLMDKREAAMAQAKEAIALHSAAVKAAPKNLKAWVELGDAFMQAEQFADAANAYKRAVVLSNGTPLLILAYARAIILADGKVGDHAKKSLEMVLLQDKENAEAKYWLAVRQLQDGDTQEAMAQMRKLYKSLPSDSPVKRMIDRQIGKYSKLTKR